MLRRALLALSLAVAAGPGLAQKSPLQTVPTPSVKPPSRTTPVLITADQVNYDRARSLVIAKGNVEISQGGRVLKADQIVYDQKAKTVTATGNISLKEPSGEIVFAKRLVLKDDLRDGVVQNFRMLFQDDTRVAANSAVRSKGRKTEMREVVFSPCRLCEKDPTRAPLWQLKARRVVHDQVTRDIEYYDAWMEVFGVPVVYTPYFRHPDPTVKRRRGFLTPIYRSDSVLGFSLETPYFVPLGPDKDLTLSPRAFTKVRPALGLEWRHRVKGGAYDIVGTITNVKRRDPSGNRLGGDQTRGYVFTRGSFNLDRKWRSGWSGGWTSDDSFLRRYGINTPRSTFTAAENVITSTAYAEAFKGRNYFSTRGYSFQGLREEDDFNRTPVILPMISYKSLSMPLGPWGRGSLDINAMGLHRIEGTNSRRLSVIAGWELPFTSTGGHVFKMGARFQGDIYWVANVAESDRPGSEYSGIAGRAFPQAFAEWKYPLVRELGNVRHVISPRIAVIGAPNFGNPEEIPNEDSLDFELDDTNIFRLNRFNGIDRVERGSRVVYGITSSFYGNRGGKTEIFLGNSYRFTGRNDFPNGSGVDQRLSDLVGRLAFEPADYLSVVYRFRLDTREFNVKRHEVQLSGGLPWLRVSSSYIMFDGVENNAEFGDREELTGTVIAEIAKNWSVNVGARYSFKPDDALLNWQAGIQFQNECCKIRFDFQRTFTIEDGIEPTNRFLLTVVLKHLGEISASR